MAYYYSFSDFLRKKFSCKIYKISVDAGFTCPNRDGTKGRSGCSFCNNAAFSPALSMRGKSLREQITKGMDNLKKRRKNAEKFIVYFQPFSNTYGDTSHLKKLYLEALSFPEVVGISVGTRADCLPEETLSLIRKMAKKTYFCLEIGLESSHNRTLETVNRGHTFEEFLLVYKKARNIPHLNICIHLIHGLPGETKEMMLETVRRVNELKPDSIKFHQLEIVKDTPMEVEYSKGKIRLLSIDEYLEILGESLEILDPNIVIQRLFGFTPEKYLVAPLPEKKVNYNHLLNKYLSKKNIYQGLCYEV